MPWDRDELKTAAGRLAAQGVLIGTSSWKYPGWQGQLYTQDRYVWHGRFSRSRFERLCLAEYAEVFKTVSVDASYYQFPTPQFLEPLVSQAPLDFLFTFKVTDQITVKHFHNVPRYGERAGKDNTDFLNADRFETEFLAPCQPFRSNVGLLIFEFSRFSKTDFQHGRDFVEALDSFLARLPRGWNYGVEIRNRAFLHPDYFATLTRHGVAHIFSSWQDMPPLDEQIALPGALTARGFFGARLLLRPGRKYEDAVKLFSPYETVKDLYPEGRAGGAKLIQKARLPGENRKGFIYVNNRFEGNALQTIAGIIELAQAQNAQV